MCVCIILLEYDVNIVLLASKNIILINKRAIAEGIHPLKHCRYIYIIVTALRLDLVANI